MNILAHMGGGVRATWGAWLYSLGVAWTALCMAASPRTWSQPVRNVLVRQILFTGFDAWRFISMIALLVGVAVVMQAQLALTKLGMSEKLGTILVAVVIREVGPLLTNFAVIGRSGNAMASEMASMKINGEVYLLDAMGIDPFIYLVIPRVIGAAVSTFCLSIIFVVMSFLSGYLFGSLLGANAGDPYFFVKTVFAALSPADVVNLVVKSFVPGLLTGAICCTEGLRVQSSFTEIPQATSRAVVRSMGTLFIISAVVSVVTYV